MLRCPIRKDIFDGGAAMRGHRIHNVFQAVPKCFVLKIHHEPHGRFPVQQLAETLEAKMALICEAAVAGQR